MQYQHFDSFLQGCRQRNVRLFPQPAIDDNNRIEYTPQEIKVAKRLCHVRKHHLINREVPVTTTRYCTGGHNYITVLPNGDTYRCAATANNRKRTGLIGNLLEAPNVLCDTTMTECRYGRCCGCDEDNAFIDPPLSAWYEGFNRDQVTKDGGIYCEDSRNH